jgi:geranylgeranyl diphosphate synthase type I
MREALAEWRPVIDETIEELLPREIDHDYLSDYFGAAAYRYDPEAVQRALADPIWDLLDRGGKRWRAVLLLVLVDGFGEDPRDYLQYACIPEILHNGTIIVDDVEDGATMRRGEPALHHEYGVDIALNAGNAMYFLPLKVITRNPAGLDAETRLAAYEMLMHELNRTHLGQGMDIRWHNAREVGTDEDEYLEMGACKTGALGRIVARLAAIITDNREDEAAVARFAEELCVAFQVADDILDVEHAMEAGGDFGKGVGNDIREGKKTLMVIHAVTDADPADAERLTEILWAEDNTDAEVQEAIGILQDTGSVEYARDHAEGLAVAAREHLDDADLDPEVAAQLADFTRFVVERET